MDDQERYERAKQKVAEIKGVYVHAVVYVLGNISLFLINILSTPEFLWFYWPLLGWGIGLLAHAAIIFGLPGLFGPEWEERKIREIMEKDKTPDRET